LTDGSVAVGDLVAVKVGDTQVIKELLQKTLGDFGDAQELFT
jgi:hypothetical protein